MVKTRITKKDREFYNSASKYLKSRKTSVSKTLGKEVASQINIPSDIEKMTRKQINDMKALVRKVKYSGEFNVVKISSDSGKTIGYTSSKSFEQAKMIARGQINMGKDKGVVKVKKDGKTKYKNKYGVSASFNEITTNILINMKEKKDFKNIEKQREGKIGAKKESARNNSSSTAVSNYKFATATHRKSRNYKEMQKEGLQYNKQEQRIKDSNMDILYNFKKEFGNTELLNRLEGYSHMELSDLLSYLGDEHIPKFYASDSGYYTENEQEKNELLNKLEKEINKWEKESKESSNVINVGISKSMKQPIGKIK